MDQLMRVFGLKREAVLLDSWLYILKSMCAIGVGFLLGKAFSITRLDMISVLLGVMYNLEAVNVSGVKGALNQMTASTLGALSTGFLVFLMGYHVSFVTVALGMGLTLYIALKIDYRMVSPVAIFTSVYMTQLLQSDALGNPSVLLTFRLRISALGLGVLIALAFNYVFSLFYYRKIGKKRMEFARLQGVSGLKKTYEILLSPIGSPVSSSVLASVFNDIEMVKANIRTMMKENSLPFNRREKANLTVLDDMVNAMKSMIHLAYDCIFMVQEKHIEVTPMDLKKLNDIVERLGKLDFTHPSSTDANLGLNSDDEILSESRIKTNLSMMEKQFNRMVELSTTLK
ncbi:MAG: hypothetical protein JXK92_09890 [Erysipelotrichaceae bacterium]|nr:hypothetical protein [Erysipelotrichaceae bacterium]